MLRLTKSNGYKTMSTDIHVKKDRLMLMDVDLPLYMSYDVRITFMEAGQEFNNYGGRPFHQ